MAKINADPVVLRSVASELDRIASDMSAQKQALSNASSDTAIAWQSAYTGQFLDSVNSTGGKINSTADDVREAARRLRQLACEVERVESEIRTLNSRG